MAASDKNIVISPQRGSATLSPSLVFTGDGADPISIYALDGVPGSLSFEGSAGQLFSITNNLTSGSIFSVNDVSGIPSIDVDASGLVQIAPLGGTVAIGQSTVTAGQTVDIKGNLRIDGELTITSSINIGNLSADFLDGLDSSQFVRSDVNDTVSGTLTMAGGNIVFPAIAGRGIYFGGETSGTSYGFIREVSDGQLEFGSDEIVRFYESDALTLRVDWSMNNGTFNFIGTLREDGNDVWHAGNDGSGSGLDADLWDGNQFSSYLNQAVLTGSSPSFNQVLLTNNGNGTNVKIGDDAWLGDVNIANTIRLQGNQNAANGYIIFGNSNTTALGRAGTGVLTYGGNTVWHGGSDGAGSGLDADTLDGIQSGSFLRSDIANTATGLITFSGTSSAPFRLVASNASSSWDAVTFQATNEWGDGSAYGVLGGDGSEGVMLRRPHVVWNSSHASADIRLGRSGGISGGAWVNIGVKASNVGFIGYENNNVLTWGSSAVAITNSLTVAGNTSWHAGNDGSGSGLDADLLDGINSGSFLRSDADDTATGVITLSGSGSDRLYLRNTTNAGEVGIRFSDISDQTQNGYFRFRHADATSPGSAYGVNFEFSTDQSNLAVIIDGAGDYFVGTNKVWNASNDGSGSGLDADLLDGQQGSYYQPASSALTTSTSFGGDVSGTYNTLQVTDDSHNHTRIRTHDDRVIEPSADNAYYMHFGFTSWANNNTAPYADYLHLRSYSDSSGGSDNLVMFKKSGIGMRIWQQTFGSSTAYSSYVDVWTSGNDGSGSGLDADLLDGQQGSYYLDASNINAGTLSNSRLLAPVSGNWHRGVGLIGGDGVMEIGRYIDFHTSNVGTSDYDVRLSADGPGDLRSNGSTVWTAGNDGAGSGLDADSLDGYTWDSSGKNVRATEFYADNWFRNYNSGEGLYNEANAMHWYSDTNWRWRLYGTSTSAAILFTTNGNTARGYLYADTASSIGFLNTGGQWGLRYLSNDGNSPNLYFREEANETWTGNPGSDEGKIEYHSNRFYIASGSNSTYVCQFRRSGADVARVENDGKIYAQGSNLVWHAGNDGSGSGLDADLLDGTQLQTISSPNYASSANWTVGTGNASDTGTGGGFGVNGDGNLREWGIDPFGRRGLIWVTRNNDATSDADGGWNKTITGLDSNKSYMSVVYVRRTSSSSNGSFYHGCGGGQTLNLNGTANTNPYFSSFGIGTIPQDVWCVSIGFIRANNDSNTSNTVGGLYRLDTGDRIVSYTDFKMVSGTSSQVHRTYLYYSTDPAAELHWWGPGFYEVNGQEPSIENLIGSAAKLYNGNITKSWNAINDGAGSGLDADLLDGVQGSSYLRADADDTFTRLTGTRISVGYDHGVDNSIGCSAWFRSSGSTGWYNGTYGGGWYMIDSTWIRSYNNKSIYHNTGTLRTDGTLQVGGSGSTFNAPNGGTVTISGNTAWHAGNDGSGSGLDADLLDGINSGSFLRSDANDSFSGTLTGSGNILTSGTYIGITGDGGGVAMTTNDGYGNANLTFNHRSGVPDKTGNAFRIETNVDSTSGASMVFELKSGVTGGSAISLNNGMTLTESSLTVTGNINSSSDRKLKTNIKTLANSLEKVLLLRGVEYDRIDLDGKHQIGVIAQEIEEIVPEVVSESEEGVKNVAYGNITAILIEAIKEQQKQIEELKSELQSLKDK